MFDLTRRAGIPSLKRLIVGVLLFLGIGLFYGWTAAPDGGPWINPGKDSSYYNLLADGMAKGHLWLDIPDDPFLQSLADPYRLENRQGHGLHDASYYRGKTYIYFGVTPAVSLYLPFRLLTGAALTDRTVVVLYSGLGWLFSFLLVSSLQQRYFPKTPGWLWALSGLVLALATLVPPVLRRPTMYEVVISGGYAHFMAGLYFLWRSLHAEKRAGWWLAAASLSIGLAVGCRPVYLPGAIVLLVPWVLWWRTRTAEGAARENPWRSLAAAIVPIACVGVGLAAYNFARFDSPFEFGQKYQMSGGYEVNAVHFGLQFLPFNAKVYFLSPPGLSVYFPFLTVIDVPPPPVGQLGVEDPYGIIPTMPWVLFGVFTFWRLRVQRQPFRLFTIGVAVAGAAITLVVCCFAGNTGRYQVDFAPTWMILASIGVLIVVNETEHLWLRRVVMILSVTLGVISCLTNVLLSLQHNRLFALEHPDLYRKVAHGANQLPSLVERLAGVKYGPVRLLVDFPPDAVGQVEPLVVTGRQFLADYLYVHYLSETQIRFGFVHTSEGNWTGEPITLKGPGPHEVEVSMGSLYPPAEHPYFERYPAEERQLFTHRVSVHLNGEQVLLLPNRCFDSTSWYPSIGTSGPDRPALKRNFSGKIHAVTRLAPPAPSSLTVQANRALLLSIRFPEFTGVFSEPILCSGVTGAGDLIYVKYIDPEHIQFGHDRWGHGGPMSGLIKMPVGRQALIRIDCPSLHSGQTEGMLKIEIENQVIWDQPVQFHPTSPAQVLVGSNPIGASSARANFTGIIDPLREAKPSGQ